MNDQNDDTQNFALAIVAGVAALVIAGVIALAVSTQMDGSSAASPKVAAQTAAAPAAADLAPVERLYFEVGSQALPADANEALARVADAARANAGAIVQISGFHDASGDPAQNAELAKNRALAVRHALEANGVSPAQLQMSKPAMTNGDGDAKAARRVELTVR